MVRAPLPTVLHQTVEWLTPLARFRHLDVLHEAVGHDVAAARSASPVAVDWVMGAVLLLPMAQVRAVGGFDEEYFMNSEEVYARKFGHPRLLKAALTAATGANFAVNALRQARGVDVDARAVLRDEYALVWKGQRR